MAVVNLAKTKSKMDNILPLFIAFLTVSTLFSMIGMGGGILYVPILLFAGFTMEQAPVLSLILIMTTSVSALYRFTKNKMVDWKLALVIDPPTDIMAFIGGYYSGLIPELFLRTTLIVVLMIAGTLMLLNKKNQEKKGSKHLQKWGYWHRQFNGQSYTVNVPLVILISSLIGILSGMLGITGGVIKLPVMVLLCGVPMGIAVATSTAMVALTAICGISGHALNGTIDWQTGLIFALAAVIGGFVGSHLSLSIDKAKLKRIFGGVVWLIALKMLFSL
jgi:uncharacterized membrane protein YfcA